MDQKPNTDEPQKPRGRWFQFRLRTLLVGVVLLSGVCWYVADDARIVYHRAMERRWLEQHGAAFASDEEMNVAIGRYSILKRIPERRLPWLREMLGDRAISAIFVPNSDILMQSALAGFSEAMVSEPLDASTIPID